MTTLYRLFTENPLNLRVAVYVLLACALATGCKAKRVVTVEQVDEMIRNHVPTGSSKAEVVAFIDSLKIDSLRVIHSERFYSSEDAGNLDPEKVAALGDRFKECYDAIVEDIAPSTTQFMILIIVTFYFGQDGKLLDYTIKEDTSFR